jgi:dipeptidyl aminopeptidase/acylaminoacyl peptidase
VRHQAGLTALDAWLLTVLVSVRVAAAQPARPMTVEDVIALRQIRRVAASPNGDLAVVVKRAGGPVTTGDDAMTDVWLVSRQSETPRNLTERGDSDTRWWGPVWSPDGARLALLTSTRNANVSLYVWSRAAGALTRLTDRDVDEHATTGVEWHHPIVWLDSVTVLCAVWPAGVAPNSLIGSNTTTQRIAPAAWRKTDIGVEPSVSVLESGRDIPLSERPQGQLLRIDVRSGATRVLADGNFWQIMLSPTKRYAAVFADAGRIPPTPKRRLPYNDRFFSVRHGRLAIVRLDSVAHAQWIEGLYDPVQSIDGPIPHSWSPDGLTFAAVAKDDPTEEYATTAYVVDVARGTVRRVSDRTLEVSGTAWAGNGTVLVFGRRTMFAPPGTDTTRHDWWAADVSGNLPASFEHRITTNLSSVPSELVPTTDTTRLLGLSAGRIVTIGVSSSASRPTRSLSPPLDGTLFSNWLRPDGTMVFGAPPVDLLVRDDHGEVFRVGLDRTGELSARHIPQPAPNATLVAADLAHELVVFTGDQPTGSFLWIGDGSTSRFQVKLSVNEYLRDIADGQRVLISYIGADGDSLKGLVALPVGYRPGHRYPLITWVYGGVTVNDTTEVLLNKHTVSALNLTVIPAHGYALLIPSMPLRPSGEPSDPMIDMSKGVLSAVDEVVRMGIADPTRLGVMGHSYGGYSTYSLLTYTHRFQAAVSLAGAADLASLYGELDAESRYTDFGFEMQHMPPMSESGMLRMGDSPWGNLWRYLRNSPYYFADRVETPVMIIQGDMDYVSLQQGEEFFSAMYRLGKRARFVRYWGDSHVVYRSPANVRDMWDRIFGWFDEQLKIGHHESFVGN